MDRTEEWGQRHMSTEPEPWLSSPLQKRVLSPFSHTLFLYPLITKQPTDTFNILLGSRFGKVQPFMGNTSVGIVLPVVLLCYNEALVSSLGRNSLIILQPPLGICSPCFRYYVLAALLSNQSSYFKLMPFHSHTAPAYILPRKKQTRTLWLKTTKSYDFS